MLDHNFVFADLSTDDVGVAQDFYSNVFGWQYTIDDNYSVAHFQGKETSGLYETPQKFKEMKMPSFWMSYVQVENMEAKVEQARNLGGIVELVDDNRAIGKVALIRDPLGAGFTIYEGNALNSRYDNEENALIWNELFISDFAKVKSFYEGFFNWRLEHEGLGRYFIINASGKKIGAISEVSNEIKGEKEYWSVFFGVKDVQQTKEKALQNNGSLIYEDGTTTVLADPFGAFFHLTPIQKQSTMSISGTPTSSTFKWKAIVGLLLIVVILATNWHWLWGILFAFWVFSDLRSGYTHLLEPIHRTTNPFLYWIIVAVWGLLGFYSAASYVNPDWLYTSETFSDEANAEDAVQSQTHNVVTLPAGEESPTSRSGANNPTANTLSFSTQKMTDEYFVGIETALSGNVTEDEQYLQQMWQYFETNDISTVIENINDERVFLVYADFKQNLNTYTKVLLGYKVENIGKVYEGLSALTVPASEFAVFESTGDSDSELFIAKTWGDIASTNLIKPKKHAVEIYTFDENNEVIEAEIWIEL